METPRIQPEQLQADEKLLNNLQSHLADWRTELQWTEHEIMEQAILDSRAGQGKSHRYLALEKRETELKANIKAAEEKLGLVTKRYTSPAFASLMVQALNSVQPLKQS